MPVLTAPRNLPINPGFAPLKPKLSLAGVFLLSLISWAVPGLHSQTYTFSTIAGIGGKPGSSSGAGGGIGFPLFNAPSGIVLNKAGNLYVTDTGNQLIREVTPAGAVTTLAGTVGQSGILDGTGMSAGFNSSQGPAVDSAGNLYVADFNSGTIRKITPAGVVTTIAGLALNSGSVDGTGSAARFFEPSAVAVDGSGNIFVADTGNDTIRKITSAGVVTTVAGKVGVFGSSDSDNNGTIPLFNYPRSIVVDGSGNLYVADTNNNTIRKITSAGVVSTLAGTTGTYGSTDATGAAARFNFPNGLALDSSGNLYVADELNHAIRKVTPAGVVTTFAGLPGTRGKVDGVGSAARFDRPTGVTVDPSGNVYVADYNNELIRKITPAGAVSTIAGVASLGGALDGLGYNLTPALFSGPTGTAVDAAGIVYVADTDNNTIRQISPSGVVSTLAGSDLSVGRVNGNGASASFNSPAGLAVDAAGLNIYVADSASQQIRKVTSAGDVTTIAGTGGVTGSADGLGTAASFDFPSSVALDGAGNLYVADFGNHTIRKITTDGQVTTLAGTAGSIGSADGVGAAAKFNHPRGVAVDSGGNVYVADYGNDTIRKISPGGLVLTLAGSAGVAGSADGSGSLARFNGPSDVAVDGSGNVFVTDANNSTIRQVTLAGVVTTLGGVAGNASNVDGVGNVARFDHPAGLAVDTAGNLFIADTRNHTIRKGTTPASGGVTGPNGGGSTGGTGGSNSLGGGTGGNGGTGGTAGTTGTSTGFLQRPGGLTSLPTGVLYVADTGNNCIKAIASDGTITVFAGKEGSAGSADGTGTAALFNGPTGMVSDSLLNIFVCDTGNATIRKITAAGVVTTLAGAPGSRGSQDGTGSAALFSTPTGIALDASGSLFITDSGNCTIRQLTSAGVVTTFAGTAKSVGDADGVGAAARFNNPTGLVINPGNVLFVADTYNNTIRKINTTDILGKVYDPVTGLQKLNADGSAQTAVVTPAGTVTTLAGSPGISGAFDGTGAYALFNLPQGVSLDGNSNVFVADTGNNCIRRVSTTGFVTTIAGIAGISGKRDGPNTTALFNQPSALLLATNITVADTGNSVLRSINALSVVAAINLKAAATTTTTTPAATTSSGSYSSGGGSFDPWFVAALLGLLAFAFRARIEKRGA